jgi:hypothetical protein
VLTFCHALVTLTGLECSHGGLASKLEGYVTEPGDPASPLSLDVVRARIFYLASDVEAVSPPAAMLLRAVADAINGGDSQESADEPSISSDELARLALNVHAARPLIARPPEGAQSSERRLGVVGSQSGYKR